MCKQRDSHKGLGVVKDGRDPQEPLDAVHHQDWVRSEQGAVYNMELMEECQIKKALNKQTNK